MYDSVMTNHTFKTGESRNQGSLLPARIEDYVGPDNPARAKASCLPSKAKYRSVSRWEHEDVLDRLRQRMASEGAGELMRRRSAIVEHPFGTLKCRAGYQHFLVRGFDKVRGEWSLMALCYNFTRVLNILGFERFAYMTEKARVARETSLASALSSIPLVFQTFQANIALWLAVVTLRATPAS